MHAGYSRANFVILLVVLACVLRPTSASRDDILLPGISTYRLFSFFIHGICISLRQLAKDISESVWIAKEVSTLGPEFCSYYRTLTLIRVRYS